jgi:hypothetical protein
MSSFGCFDEYATIFYLMLYNTLLMLMLVSADRGYHLSTGPN